MTEKCLPCKIGWHAECEQLTYSDSLSSCCCQSSANEVYSNPFNMINPVSREYKTNDEIIDQTSTGRKRASALYPLPSVESGGMLCEWAGLAFAGGGVEPIVGCLNNIIADCKEKQEIDGKLIWPGNIHHGPDKSTLNNDPSNVSRVCPVCHNRWHSLNDPYYSKSRPESGTAYLPLSGEYKPLDKETKATPDMLEWSEKYWSIPTRQRTNIIYRIDLLGEQETDE